MQNFRRILRFVFLLALWASQSTYGQGDNLEDATLSLSSEQETRLFTLLSELRLQADRSQFDLEALIDRLEYDEASIVEFVRTNIAFEQYPGVLKGSKGTLVTRGGNAADQSLLLATLLRDAGLDARIHRGTISSDDAKVLLSNISPHSQSGSPFVDLENALGLIREIGALLGTGQAVEDSQQNSNFAGELTPLEQFTIHKDLLLASLRDAGIDLGEVEPDSQLISEARDYYWVEYRVSAAGAWIEAHPALKGGQQFEIERSEVFAAEIPEEIQHRIRLELKIAQQISGDTKVSDVFPGWERPVANLAGKTIVYTTLPLDQSDISGHGSKDSSSGTGTLFVPKINGQTPAGAQTFDERGNLLPMDAAASFMAAIIRTTGNKLLSAAESISSIEKEGRKNLMRLDKLWFEIELIPPFGKAATRITRPLIQVSDRDAIANLRSQRVAFSIGVGRPSSAELLYQSLGDLLMLIGHPDSSLTGDANSAGANLVAKSFFHASNAVDTFTDTTTSYNSSPAIFSSHQDVLIENRKYSGFDIVSNQRRAFDLSSGVQLSRLVSIEAGVWETMTESWLGERTFSPRTFSIIDAFDLSQANGAERRLVVASDTDNSKTWSDGIEISGISKDLISLDRKAGYMTLVPDKHRLAWPGVNVWWRVNPDTGETLGRAGPVGWGATLAETTALQDSISWASCVMNVAAKCTEQIGWTFAIVHLAAGLTEMATDPSGKEWSWWDYLKNSPTFNWLKALLKAKTGVDLDKFSSPDEWIEKCTEKQSAKPKEEGGCGDPPQWPS